MRAYSKKYDLVGSRFRNLTVISRVKFDAPRKNSVWNCICDCGEKSIITRPTLISCEFKHCKCSNFISNIGKTTIDPITRFNNSYTINGECWEWNHSIGTNGYGKFWLNNKNISSHRAAYILFKGPIPKGLCICHTCDNRICVNPDHLWLGTYKDNGQDMVKKGRSCTGLKNSQGKIDIKTYEEIVNKYKKGVNQYTLSREYNVKQSTIHKIIHKFIPSLVNLRGENNGMSKLTEKIVLELRELHKKGNSFYYLAKKFKVNISTIERSIKGKTWSHI